MPGVRVNFSKSGPSLSVGGRGATVNFSSRGTRTTLGIPGSGLSWSESSHRSGTRAPSQRSIDAALRRAEREEQVRAAEEMVAQLGREQREIVDYWRAAPPLPSRDEFVAACSPRPWQPSETAPPAPVEQAVARALRRELTGAARSELSHHPLRFAVLSPVLLAMIVGAFAAEAAVGIAFFGTGVVALCLLAARAIAARQRAGLQFNSAWTIHWAEAQGDHAARLRAFEERQRAQCAQWAEAERARIEALERLISGDAPAIEGAISEALEYLDFPFETSCGVVARNSETALLAVDLPEIEDVIPETSQRVLKDGRIKEVKRTRADRLSDYAELACGLALLLARCAFAAAPSLNVVHVGAFTQRRQRGSGSIVDEWVYDLEISRAAVGTLEPATANPVEVVTRLPGRIDVRPTMELARINEPTWAPDALARTA